MCLQKIRNKGDKMPIQNYYETFILFDENLSSDENEDRALFESKIFEFLDQLFLTHPERQLETAYHTFPEKKFLFKFLLKIQRPFTIIQEFNHVNSAYRDMYYYYYSTQHLDIPRFSKRISFFSGKIARGDLESCSNSGEWSNYYLLTDEERGFAGMSNSRFLGSCVINPLMSGRIGFSILSPQLFSYEVGENGKISNIEELYVRTSSYEINVLGVPLRVLAFPYRMQDRETMLCGEITILNIMDYFSNTYQYYRNVLPREIITKSQEISKERVLPSLGISYATLIGIMLNFGFSPKLYIKDTFFNGLYSGVSADHSLKRLLHYYVESGIPVGLNLESSLVGEIGHSVICIGHGSFSVPTETIVVCDSKRMEGQQLGFIDSADYFEKYVIVDDNNFGYQLKSYSDFSSDASKKLTVRGVAVPLYPKVFLDALGAKSIFYSFFMDEVYGLENGLLYHQEPKKVLGHPIVTRLFLASSRSMKKFRVKNETNNEVKYCYGIQPLPRFVWVCELYERDKYVSDMREGLPVTPFAEAILDATSSENRGVAGILLARYPKMILTKDTDYPSKKFKDVFVVDELGSDYFRGYENNLLKFKKTC